MRLVSLFALMIFFQSCGKLADIKKSASGLSTLGFPTEIIPGTTTAYTPGSYFLQLKDVGNAKDVRIYEFQYLSDKSFIMTVTNFAGGTITNGYFHKKTGTYSEAGGIITHNVLTDSCNDRSPLIVVVSGDKKTIVTAVVGGTTMTLYSYATYFLPSNITSQLPLAFEDIGCQKFQ